MSSFISNNDDDIFDYDPELDNSSSNNSSSTINSSSTFSSDNDLLNKIKDHLESNDKDFNTNNAKLSIGFAHSTHHLLHSVYTDSLIKSLMISLDSITHGDFSLLYRFHQLEMKISKRMDFHILVREIFFENDSPSDQLRELFDFLSIEVTDLYISTCFLSSVAISNHALMLDRSEYIVLAKKLNIPTKHYLLESTPENETMNHNIFLNDFTAEVRDAINNSISSDVISQLKTSYNIDARYNQL